MNQLQRVIKLSKIKFPPVVFLVDGKEVTQQEFIAHLNKKQSSAATEQKKIS